MTDHPDAVATVQVPTTLALHLTCLSDRSPEPAAVALAVDTDEWVAGRALKSRLAKTL